MEKETRLEKLVRLRNERIARKKEKERLKKQKEEEKILEKDRKFRARLKEKELKRRKWIRHKRNIILKSKRKYNRKIRDLKLAQHKANNDEYSFFNVIITKNNKKIKGLGKAWWKSAGYKLYNDALEKNRATVSYPVKYKTKRENNKRTTENVKYEILLLKKVEENEDNVANFRDENGRFVKNVIKDCPNRVIIEKAEWYVEELFNVFGYHPNSDRKTYKWIMDNLILNNEDTGQYMKRIMVFNNRIIIERLEDFDFITCRNKKQCVEVYNKMQKDILSLKRKYIVFMGKVTAYQKKKWIERIQEKTGWDKDAIMRTSNLY